MCVSLMIKMEKVTWLLTIRKLFLNLMLLLKLIQTYDPRYFL